MITIDSDLYGDPTEFRSLAEAQAALRDLFDRPTTLTLRGGDVVNERGDVVGHESDARAALASAKGGK